MLSTVKGGNSLLHAGKQYFPLMLPSLHFISTLQQHRAEHIVADFLFTLCEDAPVFCLTCLGHLICLTKS